MRLRVDSTDLLLVLQSFGDLLFELFDALSELSSAFLNDKLASFESVLLVSLELEVRTALEKSFLCGTIGIV